MPAQSLLSIKELEFIAKMLWALTTYPHRLLWSILETVSRLGADRFQLARGVSDKYADYIIRGPSREEVFHPRRDSAGPGQ